LERDFIKDLFENKDLKENSVQWTDWTGIVNVLNSTK